MCLGVYACKKNLTHVLRKMKASFTNWLIWIISSRPCLANILSRKCQVRNHHTVWSIPLKKILRIFWKILGLKSYKEWLILTFNPTKYYTVEGCVGSFFFLYPVLNFPIKIKWARIIRDEWDKIRIWFTLKPVKFSRKKMFFRYCFCS